MDKLSQRDWVKFLNALARRLNPLINKESELDLRGYYWSIRACQYATDVMFKDAQVLLNLSGAYSTRDASVFDKERSAILGTTSSDNTV